MAAGLREHLVAYFEEHQKLVEAGALRLLLESHQPLIVSREIVERAGLGSGFVTEAMVASVLSERRSGGRASAPAVAPAAPTGPSSPARDGFRLVVEGFGPTSGGTTPIDAYSILFRSRYRALQRMLRGRPALPDLRPIRDLRPTDGGASVIGMVRDIRETSKKHHVILTVDDETGSLETLVPKD